MPYISCPGAEIPHNFYSLHKFIPKVNLIIIFVGHELPVQTPPVRWNSATEDLEIGSDSSLLLAHYLALWYPCSLCGFIISVANRLARSADQPRWTPCFSDGQPLASTSEVVRKRRRNFLGRCSLHQPEERWRKRLADLDNVCHLQLCHVDRHLARRRS